MDFMTLLLPGMSTQAETLIYTLDHFFKYIFTVVSQSEEGFTLEKTKHFLSLVIHSFGLFSHLNHGLCLHSQSDLRITLAHLLGRDYSRCIPAIDHFLTTCCELVKDDEHENIHYTNMESVSDKEWNTLPTTNYDSVNPTIRNPIGYIMGMKREKWDIKYIAFVFIDNELILTDEYSGLLLETISSSNGVFMEYLNGSFILQNGSLKENKTMLDVNAYNEMILFREEENSRSNQFLTQPCTNYLKISSALPLLISQITLFARVFNKRLDLGYFAYLLLHLVWLSDMANEDLMAMYLLSKIIQHIDEADNETNYYLRLIWQYLLPYIEHGSAHRTVDDSSSMNEMLERICDLFLEGKDCIEEMKQVDDDFYYTNIQSNAYILFIRMYWTVDALWIDFDNSSVKQDILICDKLDGRYEGHNKDGVVSFIRDGEKGGRRMYLKFNASEGISFVAEQEFQDAKNGCIYRSYYYCNGECSDQ